MSEIRTEVSLLIAFVDLARFAAQSQRVDDFELANGVDSYYEHLGAAVLAAGGTIVKFVGDAALVVFPEAAVDQGVATILALKDSVDDLMTDMGWECRLTARVHFGSVIAGPFGVENAKRFDVLGKAVNTAATLGGPGVTLSVEAFRKLGRDLRTRFKKHTPPITYIRVEDPRHFRWTARA
jgi:adenylate cyclase